MSPPATRGRTRSPASSPTACAPPVAQLEGQDVIRLCITNGRTDDADIAAVAAALIRAAA
jgi:hypothetical protein